MLLRLNYRLCNNIMAPSSISLTRFYKLPSQGIFCNISKGKFAFMSQHLHCNRYRVALASRFCENIPSRVILVIKKNEIRTNVTAFSL